MGFLDLDSRARLLLPVVLAMVACVPMPVWTKRGGTQDELGRVRYQCLQNSQQRESSSASAGNQRGYQSAAVDGMVTNDRLFHACMNAYGWYLTTPAAAPGNGTPPAAATQPPREPDPQPAQPRKSAPATKKSQSAAPPANQQKSAGPEASSTAEQVSSRPATPPNAEQVSPRPVAAPAAQKKSSSSIIVE